MPSLGIGQDDVGRQLRLVRRHVNRAEGRAHRSVDLRRGSSVECVLRGLNSAQRHVVTAIDGDRARSRRPIIERQCPHDRGFRLDRDGLLAWL